LSTASTSNPVSNRISFKKTVKSSVATSPDMPGSL
jgi:hypothetical protein